MTGLIETIRSLLGVTAWPMEVPPSYGVFHLTVMAVGFSACVVAAWLLRGLGERGNRVLLFSVGAFLALSEVYKQLMHEVVLYPGDGYNWGNFPFQLCSIPMYLCLIIPFLRRESHKRLLYDFMMLYNLLGGFIAFFEPSGIFHGHWMLTMHAVVWHMLLVFVGLYIRFSGRGGLERRDYRNATVTFCLLALVAFLINCAFWRLSEGQIKMFFVGPGNAPIIVFKQISERFGWIVSTLLYIPTVCFGSWLVLLLLRAINRRWAAKDPNRMTV